MKLTSPIKHILTAAVATAGLAATTEARAESELTYLAHRLDRQVALFRTEMDQHFRHTSAYRHLVSDINSIYRQTQHVDELSHNRYASASHFEADIRELDKLVHHIHDVLDPVLDGRSGGHVHEDTDHVHRLMNDIESTVHAMQNAVADLRRSGSSDHYQSRGRGRDFDHGDVRRGIRPSDFGFGFGFSRNDDHDHGHDH